MARFRFGPLGFGTLALAAALGSAPALAASVVDGRGQTVEVADTGRIVSVGGTVTEILYDLGLGDRIVAVDTTSVFPPDALKTKQSVGYLRQLSPEGVLAAGPTLILAEADAGPPPALAALTSASVPLVLMSPSKTPEAVIDRVTLIARTVGADEKGAALAAGIQADFDALTAARANVKTPARVLFVLALRDGRPMVAGADTAADAAIALAGATNVAAGFSGYKTMTDEAILDAAPDAVLVMTQGGPRAVTAEELFALPAFSVSPAAKGKRMIPVDGLALLGFGPRTADAALDLCAALHPECRAGAE